MTDADSGPEAEPSRVTPKTELTETGESEGAGTSRASGGGQKGRSNRAEAPDLQGALSPRRAELRCRECGYGVVATEAPEACPMCQTSSWEEVPRGLAPRAG